MNARLAKLLEMLLTIGISVLALRFGVPPPAGPEIHLPPSAPPTIVIPPQSAPPPAVPNPRPTAEPVAALGRIQFGQWGCTATVIGPRREDGRYWVLTAAHCVSAMGQHGTMRLKDGRSMGIVVAARDPRPDVCWCYTESNAEVLPVAYLATETPAVGTPVWHAGYGQTLPTVRKDGVVLDPPNADGQIAFKLAVDHGDSGGGIFRSDTGEVVGTVCCTSALGKGARMYAGGPLAIRAVRPAAIVSDDWTPHELPVRP